MNAMQTEMNRFISGSLNNLPKKKLIKKEHLYLATSDDTNLYLVKKGSFKAYHINDDAEEIINGFYFQGNIIGLDKLYKDKADFFVQATVNSEVSVFSEDGLYDNAFLRACLKQEIERERINGLILSATDTRSRIATFFLHYINNVAESLAQSRKITLTVTLLDLSKYLSMTNENLSRVLSEFKKNNTLILSKGTILYYNKIHLEKIAGLTGTSKIISID
jgi:CRP/FNR family transcriptional regulator